MNRLWRQTWLFVVLILAACTTMTPMEVVFEDAARQQQLRSIQTATFDVAGQIKAMRVVIVTLQDLGFVINQADSPLGYISATKLDGYNLHASVMVSEQSPGRVAIRASFSAGMLMVQDEAYQAFFASLNKNLM